LGNLGRLQERPRSSRPGHRDLFGERDDKSQEQWAATLAFGFALRPTNFPTTVARVALGAKSAFALAAPRHPKFATGRRRSLSMFAVIAIDGVAAYAITLRNGAGRKLRGP
jgi:hypothetical protein